MSIGEQGNILVDSEEIRTVIICKLIVVLITNDCYIHDEIKRRISLDKAAMAKLTKIMKDSGVSTNTKVKLVQTIVSPRSAVWMRKLDVNESRQREATCL
jgi:hypothetical protein